jgi:uncharacterized protein YijF (DUF1287 family)
MAARWAIPHSIGVCTDVIIRAFATPGSTSEELHEDIRRAGAYPMVKGTWACQHRSAGDALPYFGRRWESHTHPRLRSARAGDVI